MAVPAPSPPARRRAPGRRRGGRGARRRADPRRAVRPAAGHPGRSGGRIRGRGGRSRPLRESAHPGRPRAARHVADHGEQHRLPEPARSVARRRSRRSTAAGSTWPSSSNHNAIFVHVRPSGDAFWPSRYAPWSEWLDRPAATAPARAGIRWRSWSPRRTRATWSSTPGSTRTAAASRRRPGAGADLDQLAPEPPAAPAPRLGGRLSRRAPTAAGSTSTPAIPAARKFVEDSMLEAVADVRHRRRALRRLLLPVPGGGPGLPGRRELRPLRQRAQSRADWRRDNVNTLVQEMSERIKAAQAVGEVRHQPVRDLAQRQHRPGRLAGPAGLQSYDDIYADTRTWVQQAVAGLHRAAAVLGHRLRQGRLRQAAALVVGAGRGARGVQLYIGQADYRVGRDGRRGATRRSSTRQLALNDRVRGRRQRALQRQADPRRTGSGR